MGNDQLFVRVLNATTRTQKVVVLEAKQHVTLATIKQLTCQKENLNPNDFVMFFPSTQRLDETQTLAHYRIEKESTVTMVPTSMLPQEAKDSDGEHNDEMLLIIENGLTSKTKTLEVQRRSTVGDLKQQLGLLPFEEQYYLTYEGKNLDDDSRTLAGYDLSSDGIVRVLGRLSGGSMEVFVSVHNGPRKGETICVAVESSTTIQEFKHAIEQKEGMAIADQILVWTGQQTRNEHTLSDYNIKNGDSMHLVLRNPRTTTQPQ